MRPINNFVKQQISYKIYNLLLKVIPKFQKFKLITFYTSHIFSANKMFDT